MEYAKRPEPDARRRVIAASGGLKVVFDLAHWEGADAPSTYGKAWLARIGFRIAGEIESKYADADADGGGVSNTWNERAWALGSGRALHITCARRVCEAVEGEGKENERRVALLKRGQDRAVARIRVLEGSNPDLVRLHDQLEALGQLAQENLTLRQRLEGRTAEVVELSTEIERLRPWAGVDEDKERVLCTWLALQVIRKKDVDGRGTIMSQLGRAWLKRIGYRLAQDIDRYPNLDAWIGGHGTRFAYSHEAYRDAVATCTLAEPFKYENPRQGPTITFGTPTGKDHFGVSAPPDGWTDKDRDFVDSEFTTWIETRSVLVQPERESERSALV